MSLTLDAFLQIDLPALVAAVLAAQICGLLGNFLILRRQALIGDAFSHAVLPGLVIGFLVAGSLSAPAMIAGALGAVLIAVVLIELVRRYARVEAGAAMGVVFTALFALGVVLLEAGLGNVHLDAQHALYGQLEYLFWVGPATWSDLADPALWAELPRGVVVLILALPVVALPIALLFKEFRAVTFDAAAARQIGLPVRRLNALLMALVAVAAVAAFDAVGSILVIAMFICPAGTARMLTDRLSVQVWLSLAVATLDAVLGYALAAWAPTLLGAPFSVNAAGGIALVSGLVLWAALLWAPRHGVVARRRRHRHAASAVQP
ncbi:MAG: metal ABC transporter permease [Azospirillaceae bacterium]